MTMTMVIATVAAKCQNKEEALVVVIWQRRGGEQGVDGAVEEIGQRRGR